MAIDETKQMVAPGLRVTVRGKRTETTGTFRGVGISQGGKPRVILDVEGALCPYAYDFDEVESIEVIG
jgi:hypothetical protein